MTDPPRDKNNAIGWAITLAVATTTLFVLAVGMIWWWDDEEPTYKVAWKSKEARLNDDDVPSTAFWHDGENNILIHRGKIQPERRELLLGLSFKGAIVEDTRLDDERITYRQSIDKLTFLSNVQRTSLWFLMVLAAIGGIIGVQARSISYFILHACVKNDLNLRRWWAWYGLRPFLGMIFGPLVVVLAITEVLPTPEVPQADTLTMFVLSILVGIVASMFFDKLVQSAQTLFGLDSDDAPPQPPGGSLPNPVKASGKWGIAASETVITWTASTDPNLAHYEVRMTPAGTYDAKNHQTLAKLGPDTLEYRTPDHPANAGDTASFKVYVMLHNENEVGSEAVAITRPSQTA